MYCLHYPACVPSECIVRFLFHPCWWERAPSHNPIDFIFYSCHGNRSTTLACPVLVLPSRWSWLKQGWIVMAAVPNSFFLFISRCWCVGIYIFTHIQSTSRLSFDRTYRPGYWLVFNRDVKSVTESNVGIIHDIGTCTSWLWQLMCRHRNNLEEG